MMFGTSIITMPRISFDIICTLGFVLEYDRVGLVSVGFEENNEHVKES